ncbi:MAG: YbjQ family protein [Acutalibacter sp.]|nr:YbjQ family protein [Acutalibacter sp.]
MLLLTIETVPGREIGENLGLVTGSVVTSKHFGKDFMAGMKTLVGGEIKGYTEMLEDARRIALERLQAQAAALGADAIVGLRLTSSSVMQSAAEVTAYGTAVKLR